MSSVAVIVLDTLRQDYFFEQFDWLSGIQFTNAWSTSHWTGPAHASLLTGRYPTEIGTTVKSRSLTCDDPLITEQLQDADYTTRMVSTNLQIFVWDGWDRGFDERYGASFGEVDPTPEGVVDWGKFSDEGASNTFIKYLRAVAHCLHPNYKTVQSFRRGYQLASGNQSSIEAVSNRLNSFDIGDNEFVLANIMDMHTPYHPPEDYRTTDKEMDPGFEDGLCGNIENPEEIRQAYENCARFLSDRYRELHADLVEEFDYVITLSDHGEHLGEDGLWTHSYGLRPELTQIPVVISGDGVDDAMVETPVSLVDVHATIADLTGLDISTQGDSLLDRSVGEERLVEYHGLSDGRREKFADRGIAAEFSEYDEPLDGIIGPDGYAFETTDEGLLVSGGWSSDEAQDRLDDLRESIERQPIQSDNTDTPDSIQQQLEALGYA